MKLSALNLIMNNLAREENTWKLMAMLHRTLLIHLILLGLIHERIRRRTLKYFKWQFYDAMMCLSQFIEKKIILRINVSFRCASKKKTINDQFTATNLCCLPKNYVLGGERQVKVHF